MIFHLAPTRVFLVRSMAGLSQIFAKLRRCRPKPECFKAVPSMTVSLQNPHSFDSPTPSPPARLPPPYDNKTFCRLPSQNPSSDEIRYCEEISYQVRVRLGLAKALVVLQREFNGHDSYEMTIRPYDLKEPSDFLPVTMLIPGCEAHTFADSIRSLIDLVGLQCSCQVLKDAKSKEVPGIRYLIQRIGIPSPSAPVCSETSATTSTQI